MAFTTFPGVGPYSPEELTTDLNTNFGKTVETALASVADGEFLVYDGSSTVWINRTAAEAGIPLAISDLSDVTIATVANGEFLVYNTSSASWVNATAAEAGVPVDLEDLGNVSVSSVADGDVLAWNASTSSWINSASAGGGGSADLAGLTDTTITSPADGEVLTYDTATGKWINSTGAVSTRKMARVTTAGVVTGNYTAADTVIPYNTEVYDVGGWHDNVTNNSRLTVPAGVTKVTINAGVYMDQMSGEARISILRNGVTTELYDHIALYSSLAIGTVSTGPLDVTTGDYFEVTFRPRTDTTVSVPVSDLNYFTIMDVSDVGGGGGGSADLAGLTDTTITSPADGEYLVYDSATSKWVNSAGTTAYVERTYTDTLTITAAASADWAIPADCVRVEAVADVLTATANFVLAVSTLRGGVATNYDIGSYESTPPATGAVTFPTSASALVNSFITGPPYSGGVTTTLLFPRDASVKTRTNSFMIGNNSTLFRNSFGAASSAGDDDTLRYSTSAGTMTGVVDITYTVLELVIPPATTTAYVEKTYTDTLTITAAASGTWAIPADCVEVELWAVNLATAGTISNPQIALHKASDGLAGTFGVNGLAGVGASEGNVFQATSNPIIGVIAENAANNVGIHSTISYPRSASIKSSAVTEMYSGANDRRRTLIAIADTAEDHDEIVISGATSFTGTVQIRYKILELASAVATTTSGTSFPVSPTTGDRFFRTDRNFEYFYNGTNWLTTQVFTLTTNPTDALLPATSTSGVFRSRAPVYLSDTYGIYWESMTYYYATIGTGSWTAAIYDVIGSISSPTGLSTGSDGTTVTLGITRAVGAGYVYWTATENSGTASFYFNATLGYRLVG